MQSDCWLCLTMEVGNSRRNQNTSTRMALSVDELRKELNKGRKRKTLALAMLHQNRIRFHTQAEASTPMLLYAKRYEQQLKGLPQSGVWQALADFLAFVENLLPHDKYKIFKSLFRFLFGCFRQGCSAAQGQAQAQEADDQFTGSLHGLTLPLL